MLSNRARKLAAKLGPSEAADEGYDEAAEGRDEYVALCQEILDALAAKDAKALDRALRAYVLDCQESEGPAAVVNVG